MARTPTLVCLARSREIGVVRRKQVSVRTVPQGHRCSLPHRPAAREPRPLRRKPSGAQRRIRRRQVAGGDPRRTGTSARRAPSMSESVARAPVEPVECSVQRLESALCQQIRVDVRQGSGTGVPLVLCNGVGASLEVFDPLVDKLDRATTVVRFDVPGAGGIAEFAPPVRVPVLGDGARPRAASARSQQPGRRVGAVLGWRLGPAVRISEPTQVPAADTHLNGHRRDNGAWQPVRAAEDPRWSSPRRRPRPRACSIRGCAGTSWPR